MNSNYGKTYVPEEVMSYISGALNQKVLELESAIVELIKYTKQAEEDFHGVGKQSRIYGVYQDLYDTIGFYTDTTGTETTGDGFWYNANTVRKLANTVYFNAKEDKRIDEEGI